MTHRRSRTPVSILAPLLVEPNVLETPVIVDAVLLQDDAPDVRMPTGSGFAMQDNGTGHVLGKLPLDVPNDVPALDGIGLFRLLENELVHLGVAVLRHV